MHIPENIKQKKILAVDDSSSARDYVTHLLEDVDFLFTIEAKNDAEAIEKMKK